MLKVFLPCDIIENIGCPLYGWLEGGIGSEGVREGGRCKEGRKKGYGDKGLHLPNEFIYCKFNKQL